MTQDATDTHVRSAPPLHLEGPGSVSGVAGSVTGLSEPRQAPRKAACQGGPVLCQVGQACIHVCGCAVGDA